MAEDIVKMDLGKEGSLDIDLVDGKLALNVAYIGSQADAKLSVAVSIDQLLDKLAEKASPLVKSIVSVLKIALKAV